MSPGADHGSPGNGARRAEGASPFSRSGLTLSLVTLAGLLGALAIVLAQALSGTTLRTFCVPAGLTPQGGPVPCSFVIDPFALTIAGLVLVSAIVVTLLSMTELADGRIPVGEWYFLLLCSITGAVLLPASRDLITLVVALEIVSLPVFALTALRRYDGRSSEAALKLFLVSVVSTAVMLFGVSLLYGLTGTVYLDRLSLATGPRLVSAVAVVLVVAGFAFKIAAVPFHSWAGDVYQGAPVPVAALLSVISKAAGFAGLILLLVLALDAQVALWGPMVAVLAGLTMTVGNLLALRQRHAVRLLAWSSVAQSGYILAPLGVAAAGTAGVPGTAGIAGTAGAPGMQPANASIAYLVFYAAMNLGAFAVVMLVSRRSARNEIDDYRGLAFRDAPAAVALGFCLICLAGLPPGLAGLFAKIVVFREIVGGGGAVLALVMAVNTVIGLYYYVAWTARLFTPSPTAGEVPATRTRATTPIAVAAVLAVAVAVAFSVAPQAVLGLLPGSLSAAG
ncbi:NADH-quinone oxidoreductase subunit N [Spongiactinospora gelatinilytica]|uniref:NADH-quinone oxidoreductase subunit N n=1 Tax=Spongiactinospora gelatinilytica TaxID=2666298 RepID=A0A2W2G841_9ACTN|nr:NADH-quinone oxidoreductase subunit N [Spongiactinospora gelatinilytica]